MGAEVDDNTRVEPRPHAAVRVVIAVLAGAFLLMGAHFATRGEPVSPGQTQPAPAAEGGDPDEPVVSTTTTTTPATSQPAAPEPIPPPEARYVVPLTEAEPEAKQLAVDIAYSLTTYEPSDNPIERLEELGSRSGVESLTEASAPLTYSGSWSRGEVIYPQLGGLRNRRASVMVVIRQTVGSGPDPDFSVVRTLDVRLARGEAGWEFDSLSSAGGAFEDLEDLALAHEVAEDSRIELPDSARLDIRSGLVSPTLLEVMAELADRTPYGVVVLATGHPRNVFETDRQSHHTIGQAVDIYRIGDEQVVDGRDPGSATRAIVEWLYDHPDVLQVGSPWDLDGESRRSFTDSVHQDHIHLAVEGS